MLRTAFKEAAWVFVLSRTIILLISYICIVVIPQSSHDKPLDCTHGIHPNPCLFAWFHEDALAYIRISHQGYLLKSDVAFFPLWPVLIRYVAKLLGGYYFTSNYLAALLLANLCFYFALVLLYCLLCEDFEPSLAKRTLFYLTFYPYALFFFLGYTESLFLLFCLAVFLLLRRGKTFDWWLAGCIGFLAALTRSSGVLLSIPFLVMYIRHFWLPVEHHQHSWLQKINALAPIVLIPTGIVAYMLYLGYTTGNVLIFSNAEATYWGRHFGWIWNTYVFVFKVLHTMPLFSVNAVQNLLDITFSLLPIIALVLGWKRLPLHYSLFALAVAAFSLSFPIRSVTPLLSEPRYMMAIFPIIVIFALWGKRPRFDQCFIALAPPLLALTTIFFVSHYWIA